MFEDDKCHYYIIDNKYVGSVYEKIWNNNGVIVKLENDDNYEDDVFSIKSNKDDFQSGGFSGSSKGFMLLTRDISDKIKSVDNSSKIIESFNLMDSKTSYIDMNLIIESVNKKINSIPIITKLDEDVNDGVDIPVPEIESGLLDRIFNEDKVVYSKVIKKEKLELDETEEKKLKKVILDNITRQVSFDTEYYYDLDKSLMYKYLCDSEIDITSFGKKIINIIIEKLLYFQLNLKNGKGELVSNGSFEEYTLFDFLEFNIKGEYIEIVNKNCENRIITREDVPDLEYFNSQYDKQIDYINLCAILSSLTNESENSEIIKEILKITCQEYVIALQPKVNLLIWCVVRILVCIYANDNFNKNIYSVKILINLFKSRSNEIKNKNNVKPLITIHPQYGNNNAFYVITRLNKYFFRFRNFGDKNNVPTYFKSSDGNYLIYYTNGSTDMKKYFMLLKNKSLKERIFDNEMTLINDDDGLIEYDERKLETLSKK